MLESSQYADFEEFMAAVQALWDAQWERVHAAAPAGAPRAGAAGGAAGRVYKHGRQLDAALAPSAACCGRGRQCLSACPRTARISHPTLAPSC